MNISKPYHSMMMTLWTSHLSHYLTLCQQLLLVRMEMFPQSSLNLSLLRMLRLCRRSRR